MKKQAVLLAEQRLCDVTGKIVLAVIGRVMVDGERVRERLMRNRFRLGPNYKEVVAYLEEKKPVKAKGVGELKDKKAAPAGEPAEKKGQGRKEKSAAMILEDDDIEDDEVEGGPQRSDEDDEEALRERGLVEDEEPTQLKGDAPPEVEGEEEDIIGD